MSTTSKKRKAAARPRLPKTYKTRPEAKIRSNPRISWFVAWTNPRCEKRAELALEAKGYEAFRPVRKRWGARYGRLVPVESTLFPRYLFVGLAPGQDFYGVRGADGIESLLKNAADIPVQVPQDVIQELSALQVAGTWDETKQPPVKPLPAPGDEVRVICGPWASFSATVLSALSEKCIEVLIQIFGRDQVVRVSLDSLRDA